MLTPVRTDLATPSRADPARRATAIPLELWLLAAIIAIGAALRFATLTSQSYWVDEATTVHEMGLSFGGMLHAVATGESTPPLYFALAWAWTKVFGTGEAGLRSLSALAGVAAIPVAYYAGRELASRWAGLLAALLAAVSPWMIWYSQEARAYMLFTLLCGLSFLFFARALRRRGSTRELGWWAACSSLALLTHFFAGFLVAIEAIWLLAALRSRAAVIACAVVAAVEVALIPLLVGDLNHPLLGWISQFPLSTRIEQVPVALGLGTIYLTAAGAGLPVAAALAVIVAILLLAGARGVARSGAVVAASVSATTIFVPLVLAALGHDYYVARNLTGAWIPLAVLVAIACTAWRTLPAGTALAALLIGASVLAQAKIQSDAQYQRPDWRAVAAALGRPTATRAVVAYDGAYATGPLAVYLAGSSADPPPGRPVGVGEVDVVGNPAQSVPAHLPPGVRLLGTKTVDDNLVARFAVAPGWELPPAAIIARAPGLLGPAGQGAEILVQHP